MTRYKMVKLPRPLDPKDQAEVDAKFIELRAKYPKPSIVFSLKDLVYFMRLGYRFYTDGDEGYLEGTLNGKTRVMMVELAGARGSGSIVNGGYGREFLANYRFNVEIYSDNGKVVLETRRYEFKQVGIEGRYTIWAVVQC